MPFDPNASALGKNKKAANWRAARAAGVKPGTRTIQADGTLGGGTPVTKPVRQPPVKPPKPGAGASGGGDKPVSTGNEPLNPINGVPGRPRDPGNMPGQTPPIFNNPPRPGRPIGGPGGPVRNPVSMEPPQDPGMTLPVQPPGSEAGKADMVNAAERRRNRKLPVQNDRIRTGGASTMPTPAPPRLDIMPWEPNYPGGGASIMGDYPGGYNDPISISRPGSGVPAPPQYPGSGGIYAGGGMDQPVGGFGNGGPMPFNDGRDIGVDNTGFPTPPPFSMDQLVPPGGGLPPGVRIPPRFGGNQSAALSFAQQNPQSRLAQALAGAGFQGFQPRMGSNPFMGPGGVASVGGGMGGGNQGFSGMNQPAGGGPAPSVGSGQEQMQQLLAMLMQGRR